MTKDEWRTFGLFVLLDLGIAFFIDDRLAVGLVGVAAFTILMRNSGKLPKVSDTTPTPHGNAPGVM